VKYFKLQQPKNLLLVALLVLLCLYTTLASFVALIPTNGEYHRILLTKANYIGFAAITGCLLSYFYAPSLFKRVLGITLLLALFGLANFLPIALSMGITLGEVPIGVSPFGFLVLIIFYFLNRTAANAFIRKYLLPAPTPTRAAQLQREAIDQFKQNFARKSDGSLRQIVQERKLVGDAIAAAQELLSERNTVSATDL
jgi:ABC-type long-subunit fatty acid transport system fused permease/ATPase subunit